MRLDHATRKRQRQTESAPCFAEPPLRATVYGRDAVGIRYDDDGARSTVAHVATAVSDHIARSSLFTQDGAENCVNCAAQTDGIPWQHRSVALSFRDQVHTAILRLVHMLGHFRDELEKVDRLMAECDRAAVEFSDVA